MKITRTTDELWARRIQRVRADMQLTQEELARKLDVTTSTVNRWENGRSMPSKLAVRALDAYLRGDAAGARS